jgi:hypothetical protein
MLVVVMVLYSARVALCIMYGAKLGLECEYYLKGPRSNPQLSIGYILVCPENTQFLILLGIGDTSITLIPYTLNAHE